MSTAVLTALVIGPTAAVVVAMCAVMWSARTSESTALTAIIAGCGLAVWAVVGSVLGARGAFLQPEGNGVPPVGIGLVAAFIVLGGAVAGSTDLRSLLANQQHLIRLNVWRLEGIVFLVLMVRGQMPALWALPAGIGDIFIGATAFWTARRLDALNGRRMAVAFNVFGLADLVVALALGMMTSRGPAQLFITTPTSELVTSRWCWCQSSLCRSRLRFISSRCGSCGSAHGRAPSHGPEKTRAFISHARRIAAAVVFERNR